MNSRTNGWLLFVLLVGIYSANLDALPNYDTFPSLYQGVSLLNEGDVSFRPSEVPFMFVWKIKLREKWQSFRIRSWNATLQRLYEKGTLKVESNPYYIARSKQPETYVSLFGFGSAVSATPILFLYSLVAGDLNQDPEALWYAGKLAATLMVAGSAVVLFFISLQFLSLPLAWLISLSYGLGTCVWSTSSQALWQHGPNVLALMLGVFFLLKIPKKASYGIPCGMALAWATICRPTSAIVVMSVAIYLLFTHRKAFVYFVLAGLPFAFGLGWYNHIHFGAPWAFGQSIGALFLAQEKTGLASLWQTPLWEGLLGHLISPSRGLLVFTPWFGFLLFAPWLWKKQPEYRIFWALVPAILLILGLESTHFDWWGGNSFGYRHLVDLSAFFALLLIPIIATIINRPILRWTFFVCLGWSICVQMIGAYAYNGWSWNDRPGFQIQLPHEPKPRFVLTRQQVQQYQKQHKARYIGPVIMDIDKPAYRFRLWTFYDSQLIYYITYLRRERRQKLYIQRKWYSINGNQHPVPWLKVN